MRTDRVPVLIDRPDYYKFKAVSERTGIPVSRLVRDAMAAFTPELERRLRVTANLSEE